ncbi:MAG: hypothetical protein GXZ08_07385 [Tissierellia bacterium]|nr:hypothetical protein [Tissierellia bacterium]
MDDKLKQLIKRQLYQYIIGLLVVIAGAFFIFDTKGRTVALVLYHLATLVQLIVSMLLYKKQ